MIDMDIEAALAATDSPEKKEQQLFQWLASLERAHAEASPDIPALVKIIARLSASSSPRPSKPITRAFTRILKLFYSNVEAARSLSDAVAAFQNILAQKKIECLAIRLNAIACLAALTEFFGSKVSYMFAETATLLIKQLKGARDSEIALRHEVLIAFSGCLKGVGKSVNEVVWKDLLKYGKLGLTDKSALIRVDAAQLLECLYRYSPIPRPAKPDDFDALLIPSLKGLEGTNYSARSSVANFVGYILASSQQKLVAAEPKTPTAKNASVGGSKSAAVPSSNANIEDEGVLSVEDMLNALQALFTKSTSKEVRLGLIQCYSALFHELGRAFVESNYVRIVKHLTTLVGNPKFTATDADGIYHRTLCSIILRNVVGKMLSESGQISALKDLEAGWLKKWSSLFGPEAPSSKWVLTFILDEITALLTDLGSASSVVSDALVESLFNLLQFPSWSVNASLSCCMKQFCVTNPKAIGTYMDRLIEMLQKDALSVTSAEKAEVLERLVGYGNSLSAVISSARVHPIHASFESLAVVFGISTQLVKAATTPSTSNAAKDTKIACAQIQIAWSLLTAMTTLGPSIMSVHMSQLLLLWKPVFPKLLPKESSENESQLLLSLVTRDGALASIHAFLEFNCGKDGGALVTVDVVKRIVVLLNNALSISTSVRALNAVNGSGAAAVQTPSQKRVQELELSVRKRLFDCFTRIRPLETFDASYVLLTKTSASMFAPDHELYSDKALPSGVATDKYGSHVDLSILTSLVWKEIEECGNKENRSGVAILTLREFDARRVEQMIEARVIGCLEYDFLAMLTEDVVPGIQSTLSLPISVDAVDASIKIFGLLFPIQPAVHQEAALEQFSKCLKYTGTKVSAGRKLAVQLNIFMALMYALKSIVGKTGSLASEKASAGIRDIALEALASPNAQLRALASEILGLVARVDTSGTFVNQLLQSLVDQIVNNREPDSRAGCALALGCIHVNAGSMTMGTHLKTSIGILHSLISDAHPLVHTWALYALWLTIESSSLSFGPYVSATLSLVIKLAMSDSHDPSFPPSTVPAGGTYNFMENNSAVFPCFGRILHALVGVLGPELASSTRMRELCFSLFEGLKHDTDPYVVVEAIRCIQQFIMFAPQHVDLPTLIPFLQEQISPRVNVHLIKTSAITCLYQLTQRDAGLVLNAATNLQLEEQCFSLLDTEVDEHVRAELRDILNNLLKHVAVDHPSRWIDLCKNILARGGGGGSSAASKTAAGASSSRNEDDDDEGAGMSKKDGPKGSLDKSKVHEAVVLVPRWRTQSFCISCMRNLIRYILDSGVTEHMNLAAARQIQAETPDDADLLIFRLADLIAISFNSATMPVKDLQIQGLYLLQDIINKFAGISDPDFEGHALLEQYQAQITAALTPAFSAESSSELMSLATVVAGTYIGSGIIKEFHPSDRVLRLLGGALDSCKAGDSFLPSISTNEKEMLRLSVLTSWAKLQLSSLKFQGSNRIIKDRVDVLSKLWVGCIQGTAEQKVDLSLLLRFKQRLQENEGAKNEIYLAATREVLAPSYKRCWLTILQAVCSLLPQQDILLTRVFENSAEKLQNFAVVMLSLAIESISMFGLGKKDSAELSSGKEEAKVIDDSEQETLDGCLICIGQIVAAKIIPWRYFENGGFADMILVFDRLIQTETLATQTLVIDIIKGIFVAYSDSISSDEGHSLAFKLILNVFFFHISNLSSNPTAAMTSFRPSTPAMASLFLSALDAITLIIKSKVFEGKAEQVTSLVFFIFTAILASDKFAADVAPKVLAATKSILESLADRPSQSPTTASVVKASLSTLLDTCQDWSNVDPAVLKNSILGVTLAITTSPEICASNELYEKVSHTLFLLISSGNDQLARIAIQCSRSLMSLGLKESASDVARNSGAIFTRTLLPVMYCYILESLPNLAANGLLDDVVKIILLPSFGSSVPALSLIVSVLVRIPATEPNVPEAHKVIFTNLLQIASQQQTKFREMMVHLTPEARVALENGFKSVLSAPPSAASPQQQQFGSGGAVTDHAGDESVAAPKIQLKMFGAF
ncbi:hypothetical protein HDU80_010574 [Chytriomyces hyalinus]|nr:hypothetical protein HDU80_010574 [Chytriomyces hyalinus]